MIIMSATEQMINTCAIRNDLILLSMNSTMTRLSSGVVCERSGNMGFQADLSFISFSNWSLSCISYFLGRENLDSTYLVSSQNLGQDFVSGLYGGFM